MILYRIITKKGFTFKVWAYDSVDAIRMAGYQIKNGDEVDRVVKYN